MCLAQQVQGAGAELEPILGSESFRQDISQFHLPWMKLCNLECFFVTKNLTDFCKTVATGVEPRLASGS